MTRRRSRTRGARDDLSPYRGPIRMNNASTSMRTERINLMLFDTMTTPASGPYSFVYKPSSVTSAADWGGLQGIFNEYRVVAFEVKYLPYADGAYNATIKPASGAMATSHITGESAPSGADVVCQYDTWSPWYSYREKTVSWRARTVEELQWISTSTSNDTGAVIGSVGDLTASTVYGRFVVTFVVEFRGRR